MAIFDAPANLTDFDNGKNPKDLRDRWHRAMLHLIAGDAATTPAFFNSLQPPGGVAPVSAAPEWTGLPRTIKRLSPGSIAAAAGLVEGAVAMGDPDPMEGRFTPSFIRADSGKPFVGPKYRPQDEYLEWVARKDADGVITEVLFTCEGPEYWDSISSDKDLLLSLYRGILDDKTITDDELRFPVDVTWKNPNSRGGPQRFKAGDYNPYNKRNIEGAIHLTHPANTLGAEVVLARAATLLYGNPTSVTTDPALVCCAEYGGINRMSDPAIGSAVNAFVRAGRSVSLRDPIGLYIKDIRLSAITLPDNTPLPAGAQFFEPLRPKGGGEMIVRARFHVPPGVLSQGKQVRVGDLKIAGQAIVAGGQLADLITMRLFAVHIAGAPRQKSEKCGGRPCADKDRPEFIHAIPFEAQCPSDGVSTTSLAAALTRSAEAAAALITVAEPESRSAALTLAEKFGVSRTRIR